MSEKELNDIKNSTKVLCNFVSQQMCSSLWFVFLLYLLWQIVLAGQIRLEKKEAEMRLDVQMRSHCMCLLMRKSSSRMRKSLCMLASGPPPTTQDLLRTKVSRWIGLSIFLLYCSMFVLNQYLYHTITTSFSQQDKVSRSSKMFHFVVWWTCSSVCQD